MSEFKKQYNEVRALVLKHFNGDDDKTNAWMSVPNPMLGDTSPTNMLLFGRYEKLMQFVKDSLEENQGAHDEH